jgi:hypothetical protein
MSEELKPARSKITIEQAFETVVILFKDLQRENDILKRRLVQVPVIIEAHKRYYSVDVFPEDGESIDCKSAKMARHTCDVLMRAIKDNR